MKNYSHYNRIYLQAAGLSHITWGKVTSSQCNRWFRKKSHHREKVTSQHRFWHGDAGFTQATLSCKVLKKHHFALCPPKKTMVANVFQLISYMGLPIGRRSFNGVWGTTQKINPPWYCPIQIPFQAYCASLNPIVRRSMTSISCQE